MGAHQQMAVVCAPLDLDKGQERLQSCAFAIAGVSTVRGPMPDLQFQPFHRIDDDGFSCRNVTVQ
jgi:hypothetical protein